MSPLWLSVATDAGVRLSMAAYRSLRIILERGAALADETLKDRT
jgi:hypothetical protein